MKILKWFLECPLLFLILACWTGLTAYTFSEGKAEASLKKEYILNPVFTALVEPDEGLPDTVLADLDDMQDIEDTAGPAVADKKNQQTGDSQDTQKTENKTDSSKNNNGNTSGNSSQKETPGKQNKGKKEGGKAADKEQDTEEEAGVTRYEHYEKQQIDSPYYSDPGMRALTTEYAYEKVDKSYFDDAVFIGDSRTDGMRNYSGLDNAAFFAKTGLNVYELLEDEFIEDPSTGKKVSVTHMMKHNNYSKIYFMIGINELGTGNTATFQKAYERVISKFRKWQPDAVIYIQGILPVSKSKSASDPIFNNININDKNVAISQLADGKHVFYLDVGTQISDKKGNLKDEYTFDDVHMYAQHYSLWTQYLMEHAVVCK